MIKKYDDKHEEENKNQKLKWAAIMEVFWNNTLDSHTEMGILKDILIKLNIAEAAKEGQLKNFIMMLPEEIIASAMHWGLSDTAVSDSIYQFAGKTVNW